MNVFNGKLITSSFSNIDVKEGDRDFNPYDGGWIRYYSDLFEGPYDVKVNIYDCKLNWEYGEGTYLGEDTALGGGWYEKPGYYLDDAYCKTNISFMSEDTEISREDFLLNNPNVTDETLNEFCEIATSKAKDSWEYDARENAEYDITSSRKPIKSGYDTSETFSLNSTELQKALTNKGLTLREFYKDDWDDSESYCFWVEKDGIETEFAFDTDTGTLWGSRTEVMDVLDECSNEIEVAEAVRRFWDNYFDNE